MISPEFLITSLIVVLIPGTGVIYTISTGLFTGARASIFAALGCTIGIVPHLVASVLGLAAILHMSSVVFQLVKFLGVAYLLYLGWSMWRDSGLLEFRESKKKNNLPKIALRGTLINILNPKLSLFFLAFLPQFLPVQSVSPLSDMLLLSGIFMLMTFVVFIAYGLLANRVRGYIVDSPVALKNTQRVFAATFIALGARLALTEQ